MAKITANKTVYWDDGFRQLTGRVKLIMQDHAVVEGDSGRYIVSISKLSTKPIVKASSGGRIIISSKRSS